MTITPINKYSHISFATIKTFTDEIHLTTVLRAGQAFRWRKINDIWSCSYENGIICLRERYQGKNMCIDHAFLENRFDSKGLYQVSDHKSKEIVFHYLNLKDSLREYHTHWSKVDGKFPQKRLIKNTLEEKISDVGHGVRILNQNPWETLISFIISSNNNIKRISQLCETLSFAYGNYLGEIDNVPYYSFPKPIDFLKSGQTQIDLTLLEAELRKLGFGYRAKYISNTVNMFLIDEKLWIKLHSTQDDESCIEFLRLFPGVGPKVADCVALMGCGRHDLVPIDTHVWQFVQGKYKQEYLNWISKLPQNDNNSVLKTNLKKSLSNKAVDVKLYPFIRQFFKELWGLKPGWAQAVLFAAKVDLSNGINSPEDVERLKLKASIVDHLKEEVLIKQEEITFEQRLQKDIRIKIEETEIKQETGIKQEIDYEMNSYEDLASQRKKRRRLVQTKNPF